MLKIVYVLLIIYNFANFLRADVDILCSPAYCEEFCIKSKTGCNPEITNACDGTSETLKGEYMSAVGPCNCAKLCLEYLDEGSDCTLGSPDAPPPTKICGPTLTCSNDTLKCIQMSTKCLNEQKAFDEKYNNTNPGAYMIRPKCDADGNYFPMKCKRNHTCICVDELGNRLFGEAVYSDLALINMGCRCSRMNSDFHKFMSTEIKQFQPTARCLADGSFDPMQCFGDRCICVESTNGEPESNILNATSTDLEKFPCFNNLIHRKSYYFHDCEAIQFDTLETILESEKEGFLIVDYKVKQCQLDGWYLPVSENDTAKFCVDKYGTIMAEYTVLKTNPLATDMNCNCARTRKLLLDETNSKDLPKCLPNGNFNKVQCIGNKFYTVDEDGIQITKEQMDWKSYCAKK